jgi:hypothetical protein
MQEVAHHLQMQANSQAGTDRDAFARSAYNRYYYACFLTLRATFAEMNADWSRTPHKTYPELLNGQIQRELKSARRQASKSGDRELQNIIDVALRSTPELSRIMTEAYGARIIADYESSISVDFDVSKRFSLNKIEISRAHDWLSKVKPLAENVLAAWKQIHA